MKLTRRDNALAASIERQGSAGERLKLVIYPQEVAREIAFAAVLGARPTCPYCTAPLAREDDAGGATARRPMTVFRCDPCRRAALIAARPGSLPIRRAP